MENLRKTQKALSESSTLSSTINVNNGGSWWIVKKCRKKFQQNLTHYAHAKKTRNWRKSRYSRTFPPNPPPLLLLLSFYYIYFYIYIFKTALPRPCRNARRLFHRQLTVLSEKYRNHSHDFQGIFWKVLQLSENLNIIKRLKNILKTTGYRKDSLP